MKVLELIMKCERRLEVYINGVHLSRLIKDYDEFDEVVSGAVWDDLIEVEYADYSGRYGQETITDFLDSFEDMELLKSDVESFDIVGDKLKIRT